ncbi:hypothetical protein ACQUK4_22630, partial [Ralstonia pseudosolanacearum]
MKRTSSLANLEIDGSDGLVAPGNPLLENVPLVPKLPAAMRALDQGNVDNFPPTSREEAVIRTAASAYVPSVETARALMAVVAQVRSSCLDRDLRMPDYRNYAIAANIFLHEQRSRETLINGVREWNREPSCSRFPHRGKEVPIEHVFRRF